MSLNFKRFFCLFLVLTLCLPLFTACGNKEEEAFNDLSPAQKVYQGKSGITASFSDLLNKTVGLESNVPFETGDFSSASFDFDLNELSIEGKDLGLKLGLNAEVLTDIKNELVSMEGALSVLGETVKLSVQADKDSLFIGSDGLLPKPLYVPLDMLEKLFVGSAASDYDDYNFAIIDADATALDHGNAYEDVYYEDVYYEDVYEDDLGYGYDDELPVSVGEGTVAVAGVWSIIPTLQEFLTEENCTHLKELVIASVPESIFTESNEKITLHFTEGQEFKTTCVSAVFSPKDFAVIAKNLLTAAKTDSLVNDFVETLLTTSGYSDEDFELAEFIDELLEELDEVLADPDGELETDPVLTVKCYYYKSSMIKLEMIGTEPADEEGEESEEVFRINVEGTPKDDESFFYATVAVDGETVLTVDGKGSKLSSYLKLDFNDGYSGFKLDLSGERDGETNNLKFSAESSEDGINYEKIFNLSATIKSSLASKDDLSFEGTFVLEAAALKLDFDLSFKTERLDSAAITLPSKENACDISDENQLQAAVTVLIMNLQTKFPDLFAGLGDPSAAAPEHDFSYE